MTTRNLRILGVDSDENLLVIEGAVPGAKDGYVLISQGEEATQRASWICGGSGTVDPLKASKRQAAKKK